MQRRILAAVIAVAGVCVTPVLAQNPRSAGTSATPKKNPYSGSPLTWSVEPIIDNYVSQMRRYYNLTPDQETYTRQLLTQRVKLFLNDYEKEVRSLIEEYMYLQLRGETPSAEQAKDLARRGGPLIAAIKKEILDGNAKWREILDENQRKIHDRDLEQMHRTFDDFEQKLDRWSKGDVRPTDLGHRNVSRKPNPAKPEDYWEARVRSFIVDYNLDAGQQATARSILRELREEATRYRQRNEEKFKALDEKLKEIYASDAMTDPEERKKAMEKARKINDEINELERPIRQDLFKQLLLRLDRIPTEDQRRMRREKDERLVRAGGLTTRTASHPETTRPATTNPAAAASVE
jgi:hypothetical protein